MAIRSSCKSVKRTDMDYKKLYDEALERARKIHDEIVNNEVIGFPGQITDIFPELCESEDERIRKWLIKYFSYIGERNWLHGEAFTCTQILAWLEKQKEPDDKELSEKIAAAYQLGVKDKEQKPVEKPKWDDSDMREDESELQTRFAFYTYKDDPTVLYLSNVFVEEASRNHGFGTRILKAAEKVAETIGASSICLKVKQNTSANEWYRKRGYGYVAFEDGYDWLQKNLEYMKPVEWSEEDEK